MSRNSNKRHLVLLKRLAEEVARGIALVDFLTDEQFTSSRNGIGSIGAHVRHNYDFANNFLKGLENAKVDYCNRERDLRIEEDRQYAKERLLFLASSFDSLDEQVLERELLVCSEVDDSNWYRSSGARELEFVHSHTVHHYALIAEKLRNMGVELDSDFGVAPSTLKYWEEQKIKAKVA